MGTCVGMAHAKERGRDETCQLYLPQIWDKIIHNSLTPGDGNSACRCTSEHT